MAVKLVFVLLVLLGIAFFVTMHLGVQHNDDPSLPQTNETKAAYTQSHPPPKFLSSLIVWFSPKLDLPQKQFVFAGAGMTIDVPPGTAQFRNATFEVMRGCRTQTDCSNVAIQYHSRGNEGEDLKLNTQPPEGYPPDRSAKRSIAVLSQGGSFTFACTQAPSCSVQLQGKP
jgi:hypothetical protein